MLRQLIYASVEMRKEDNLRARQSVALVKFRDLNYPGIFINCRSY